MMIERMRKGEINFEPRTQYALQSQGPKIATEKKIARYNCFDCPALKPYANTQASTDICQLLMNIIFLR